VTIRNIYRKILEETKMEKEFMKEHSKLNLNSKVRL
jgi:hypothetical protein